MAAIRQLSLYLENKPGHLRRVCRGLSDARVNLRTLSLADTHQFGVVRLIVNETDRAKEVLEADGFVVTVAEVVAAEVPDRPGALADVLDAVAEAGANIEYMYAFSLRGGDKAVLVFHFDVLNAADALRAAGVRILDADDLHREFGEFGGHHT